MRNKFLYYLISVSFIGILSQPTWAQESPEPSTEEAPVVTPNVSGKKAVDFPSRTSMDAMEFTRLPELQDTDMPGPVPFTPSVSAKDLPSERLIGRLNPEVFEEVAEIERDKAYLKLQLDKQNMQNQLETARAQYRENRLREIQQREDLVRTRIQWWQEQEKIRQDMEAQRASLEGIKNEEEENKIQQELQEEIPPEIEEAVAPEAPAFHLLAIYGTRGSLSAKIEDTTSNKISLVNLGDSLPDGTEVTDISTQSVTLLNKGKETVVTFDEPQ